jgi:hypothetical protein
VKIAFPVRMFIGDTQIGDNATFTEWATCIHVAIANIQHEFPDAVITLDNLQRWEGHSREVTIIVKRGKQ